MFESFFTTHISDILKSIGKGLDCIIDSGIDHKISISKYDPLAGSIYFKLLKELDHLRID